MAASKPINLLVDCLICGLNRADKNPRLLACKHGFCQNCLLKTTILQIENQLQCPVCFQMTQLSQDGASDLKVDSIVAGASAALVALKEHYTCALCILRGERKEAVAWCTNCEFRLCHICAEGHTKKPTFSTHVVVEKVCKIHIRDPSHACLTCRIGLCYECLLSGFHDAHDTCDITELKEKVTGVIAEGKRVIEREIESVDKLMNEKMDESIKILKEKRTETEEKLENYRKKMMEAITTCLDKREEEFHRLVTKALGNQNEACSQASNCLNEFNFMLEKGKVEILDKLMGRTYEMFKSLKILRTTKAVPLSGPKLEDDKCKTSSNDESRIYEFLCALGGINYDEPKPVAVGQIGAADTIERKPRKILELKNLKGKYKSIQYLYFVAANADGSAVLGFCGENYAVQINEKGDIRGVYHTQSGKSVIGVGTCDEDIYLLSEVPLTITSFKGLNRQVIRLNEGPSRAWAFAVDADSFLFTDSRGTVYRYSKEGIFQTKIGKKLGYRISVAVHPVVGKVYLVSASKELYVYKPDGELIRTIGGTGTFAVKLIRSSGCTMLPNNHILISDKDQHRVTEVTFEGEFIRHLLTGQDGIKSPTDVAFKNPYLWVACTGEVLLFKYSEL